MRTLLPSERKMWARSLRDKVVDLTYMDTPVQGKDGRRMNRNTLRNIIPSDNNPKKCQVPGCRAWRKKGTRFCGPVHASIYNKGKTLLTTIETAVLRQRKMADIRALYREALGDGLSQIFDSVAKDENERLNLSAEVDLSRVTLVETQKAVTAILQKATAKPHSKTFALDSMRKAIAAHISIVNDYCKVAERAAIATPERMKIYFEQLKGQLILELVDENDPKSMELFDRVWRAIESTELPKQSSSPTVKVEIV